MCVCECFFFFANTLALSVSITMAAWDRFLEIEHGKVRSYEEPEEKLELKDSLWNKTCTLALSVHLFFIFLFFLTVECVVLFGWMLIAMLLHSKYTIVSDLFSIYIFKFDIRHVWKTFYWREMQYAGGDKLPKWSKRFISSPLKSVHIQET